jgi:hypothetical protein
MRHGQRNAGHGLDRNNCPRAGPGNREEKVMPSMLRTLGLAAVVAASLALAALPVAADANIDRESKGVPDELTGLLRMSGDLAAWGRRTGDPLALIVAARLRASVPEARAAAHVRSSDGSEAGAPAKAETQAATVESMLAEARELAKGQPPLVAMIAEAAAIRPKGRTKGPASQTDRIAAGGKHVFRDVEFQGGAAAAVYIEGDGDSNLDLLVFDELDNEICAGTGYSDRELCRWTPRWTGPFRIEVRNAGGVVNQYRLFTN